MATNPADLISNLLNFGQNQAQYQLQAGQQQNQDATTQQNLQIGQMQIAAAQQKALQAQQQQAAKAQAWAAYQADPSHENLTKLYFAAPDEAEALSKGASLLDADAKTSQTTQNGVLYNLADAGSTDQLTTQVQGLINAEQKAGLDTSQAQGALQDLQSGDPARIASARTSIKAQTRINLAALGAKGFSIDPTADDSSDYSIEGGYLLNKKSGEHQYLGGGNPKDNYIEVKNADGTTTQKYIGPQGGGDQSSGGGALPTTLPAIADRIGTIEGTGNNASSSASGYGQFTNGTWLSTYKAANPNSGLTDQQILAQRSNPDIARSMLANLTAKNASMLQAGGVAPTADNVYLAHFLGIGDALAVAHADPNTPISQVVNRASIAANPSILAGKTVGQVQQWAAAKMAGGTPGSGASGQDITGAGPDASSGASSVVAGDPSTLPADIRSTVQAVVAGRAAAPRPGTKFGERILDYATAFDPTFDAANAQSRLKTRVDFTSGKSAQTVNSLNTAMGHLLHLDDQAHDLGNFSTAPGITNPIYNYLRTNVGNNTSIGAFEQTKQAAASEMRKVFTGSSGGSLAELEGWEQSLNSSKSYDQLHEAIKNGVDLMASRLSALQDQYATGMGRSDQIPQMIKPSLAKKASERFGIDLSGNSDSSQQGAPAAVTPTQTATNPKTGQRLGLIGGKWVPLR